MRPADPAEPMRRAITAERNRLPATPAQPALATAPAGATSGAAPAGATSGAAPAGATSGAAPALPFAEGTRPEKQSLNSEATEPRTPAPIAEVPDSAPTYPNESRPSIPLPYSYTMPRKSRDTNGLAGSTRALEKTERANLPAPSLAAAALHRDPAEWVKAILKLKSEDKTEQLSKELADFRRQYPQYVLPEELRQIR